MPTSPIAGAWLTHGGKVRAANEDCCLAAGAISEKSSDKARPFSTASPSWLVAVSDGIGGHQAGAEASRMVVEDLAGCLQITPRAVVEVVNQTHRRLFERGRKDPQLHGMGATVAGVGCGNAGLFAFSVGDSRVYQWQDGKLVQITQDDSEAELMIQQGLLVDEDGARPRFLHALTQAVGGRAQFLEIDVHIQPIDVAKGSRLLVCTDGLTDMLTRSAVQAVLAKNPSTDRAVEALFAEAMGAGGMDNITLAVVDVGEAGVSSEQ